MLEECERLLAEHDALDRCVSVEPRRREDQDADLRLLFADRTWLRSPTGETLIAAFRRHSAVTSAQRRKSAIVLRFEDFAVARLEGSLAAGETACMDGCDAFDGCAFNVSLLGANTNKALHVGHLRNIVLGHALASAMAAAGAAVQRHNLVGDIGRRVCEAMCGYLACHDGETPQSAGLAGDRFVELCSRDYQSDYQREDSQSGGVERAHDPNAEEREMQGDLADVIMRAWLSGSAPERGLWRQMREWALSGHRETLARLGVRIDRHDYESEGVERILAIVARGLSDGLFEREAGGGVVYRTGRPEYATMVLLRGDGAPTEYGRLLGVYHRLNETIPAGVVNVEVVGIEWQPVMAVQAELLTWLLQKPSSDRYEWSFHGPVTFRGEKMSSSTGGVMWIDDLLDLVGAGPGVTALHKLTDGMVSREELADTVVRGTLLCSATTQSFEFALDRMVDGPPGAGWTIAQAWCRAHALCRAQSLREPRGNGPIARTAVVQSQLFRRSLRRAVERRDPAFLASFLLGLSEAYLAASSPGPTAVPTMKRVLASLGFPAANQDSPPIARRQPRLVPSVERDMTREASPEHLVQTA